MAADKQMPNWRNTLAWSGVGAFIYLAGLMGGAALRSQNPLDLVSRTPNVLAGLGLGWLLCAGFVGLSMRSRALSARAVRNFLVSSTVAALLFLLVAQLVGPEPFRALGVSAMVAVIIGLIVLGIAVMGCVVVIAAHSRRDILEPEVAEDIRDTLRQQIYSFIVIGAIGLMLLLLAMAAPGGPLSQGVALAGVAALFVIATVLTVAIWPLLDELSHAMSRDTGNLAFYLILVIGGGWAMLAHLGFARAPAPLDWVSMFTVLMFAASFVVVGRRGLFNR